MTKNGRKMASSIVTAHLGESAVTKGLAVYTIRNISPIEERKVCTSGIYINGGEYVLYIDR